MPFFLPGEAGAGGGAAGRSGVEANERGEARDEGERTQGRTGAVEMRLEGRVEMRCTSMAALDEVEVGERVAMRSPGGRDARRLGSRANRLRRGTCGC